MVLYCMHNLCDLCIKIENCVVSCEVFEMENFAKANKTGYAG